MGGTMLDWPHLAPTELILSGGDALLLALAEAELPHPGRPHSSRAELALFVSLIARRAGIGRAAEGDALRAALLLPLSKVASTFERPADPPRTHFRVGLALRSALAPYPELAGTATAAASCLAHWDGSGTPPLSASSIPVAGQLLGAALHASSARFFERSIADRERGLLAADLVASTRGRELSPELARAAADLLAEEGPRAKLARPAAELRAACAGLAPLRSSETELLGLAVWATEATRSLGHGHGRRCASLARRLAASLGLSLDGQRLCELAALAHDIGEREEPAELQSPRGPDLEHPERGAAILQKSRGLRALAPIVRAHHERLDGSGYPAGLRGEAIPFEARVVAVAEILDGMRNEREGRDGLESSVIERELRALAAAGQLDPSAIEAGIRAAEVFA